MDVLHSENNKNERHTVKVYTQLSSLGVAQIWKAKAP